MNSTVKTFEDLNVWNDSISLVKEIYLHFLNCKDYGFKDQIQRSAVSIPSNIAKGFERNSDKDTSRFFVIAKGSVGELRTQLYIACELGYIQENDFLKLKEKAISISKMLSSLIKFRLQ